MSSEKWYFEDHGRAQGPITSLELVKMIRQGQLTQVDLVFKEGSQQWSPVENYPELVDMLGQAVTEPEAQWVTLRVTEVDGQEKYEQIGPYTTEQILQLVDRGQIKFSDYIWKPGFSNWVTLGTVDELAKPLASSVQVDMSLYQMPKHDIIEETQVTPIKSYKPQTTVLVDEPVPEEANGKDLTEPEWISSYVKPAEVSESFTDEEKSEHVEQMATEIFVEPKTAAQEETFVEISEESVTEETDKPVKTASWLSSFRKRAAEQVAQGPVTFEGTTSHFKAIRTEKLRKLVTRGASYVVAILVFFVGIMLIKNIFVTNMKSEEVAEQAVPMPPPVRKVANEPPAKNQPVKSSSKEKTRKAKPKESPKSSSSVAPTERNVASAKIRIVKPKKALNFKKMNFKQRSFYHHRDQKLIFYTSDRAMTLANDLDKSFGKYKSNKSSWSRYYKGWKKKMKGVMPVDLRDNEVNGNYVYPQLMVQLGEALRKLESRGEDYNARIRGSRNPTKSAGLDDVLSDFKKIQYKARKL